ncbi:hypothetical protein D1BOALGB6SA_9456 [Olavius sp. associated proteobacterium Delta 1]|nr:hypothetical protein D1BOALGB6SA_9456 [Olavius sp. associated proteobacterium Delta 1]
MPTLFSHISNPTAPPLLAGGQGLSKSRGGQNLALCVI